MCGPFCWSRLSSLSFGSKFVTSQQPTILCISASPARVRTPGMVHVYVGRAACEYKYYLPSVRIMCLLKHTYPFFWPQWRRFVDESAISPTCLRSLLLRLAQWPRPMCPDTAPDFPRCSSYSRSSTLVCWSNVTSQIKGTQYPSVRRLV